MAKNNISENVLIKQCLNNNIIAQKQLYDKYSSAMYTLAYRITNNKETAHDVLQETFVTVFQKLFQFRGESTLGSWIKTILIRKAISTNKKEYSWESIDDIQSNEPVIWPEDLTGEYLHQAIQNLPQGYRTVFILVEVEGYTHKEVGEMLNIAEGTSKSQLYYAKKMLQSKLKEIMDQI